jgi:predicted secreted protein
MNFPRFPTHPFRILLCSAVLAVCAPVSAQTLPVPENVVQLAASATVEVPQDLLSFVLHVTREGAEPGQIQTQLKSVLDQALAEARRSAQPGAMDVRTGNFSISPRYGREGRITGWVGTAELLLEGTEFGRISQTAGRLSNMTMAGASFRLSRDKREQAEREAQAEAVSRFRARAAELAKGFGFNGFTLREVAVNAQDPGAPPRPYMMREAKAASADAPVPVEAGKAAVVVNVSGSVQLR